MNTTAVELAEMSMLVVSSTPSTPILKKVQISGRECLMLIDSGASHCLLSGRGFDTSVMPTTTLVARGFDGQGQRRTVPTSELEVRCEDSVVIVPFVFWPIAYDYDGILGRPWLEASNPRIDWVNRSLSWPPTPDPDDPESPEPEMLGLDAAVAVFSPNGLKPLEVSLEAFRTRLLNHEYLEVFRLVLETGVLPKPTPRQVVELLNEFDDVFPPALPPELPPEREVQHDITLKPGAVPSSRAPFRHARVEEEALKALVEELLGRNNIEESNSAWVSNIFAIPKKDIKTGKAPRKVDWIRSGNAGLPVRWVIDYRHLNSQSVVPKIPLPRVDDIFDRLSGAAYFSTLDLMSGYHQMLLTPRSRALTAFQAGGELYQWVVAPMGLAGMPGSWSRLMRHLLGKPHFQAFCVVYLDDICVFSATLSDHVIHLRKVLIVLREAKLYARKDKCKWAQSSIVFLGHRISASTISLDPAKTQAIAQMQPPRSRKELQRFLGLCGYYRRFIPRYASLVFPLSELVKQSTLWTWGEAQATAFDKVRQLLQQSPVLRLPQFSQPFFVTTDASDIAVGGVLSQVSNGIEHPLAFLSRKLNGTEKRWPAYEKELYAIKFCLEKWRSYLLGSVFTVYTDNSACKWFFSKPTPSPKLLRWLDFFGQFTFKVYHKPGATNVVADALSRQAEVSAVAINGPDPAFAERVQALYRTDDFCVELLEKIRGQDIAVCESYSLNDGILITREGSRVVLPRDDRLLLDILVHYHDHAIVAHPGAVRTYLSLRQHFLWKSMRAVVDDYVRTCETCCRNKSGDRRRGMLQPLPIPTASWTDISMDFVTGLPESGGSDAVYVVVCRLSKRARYLPSRKDATAEDVAREFFNQIVVLHGVPNSIVSDRDPRFLSDLWRAMMQIMQIKTKMTVAHRAQADGQSERQIRTLEDALRCTVSHYGDDWYQWLPCIEFAHATSISTSTGLSPMEVETGRRPIPHVWISLEQSEFVRTRDEAVRMARAQLLKAQERQRRYYNRGRAEVHFQAGDFVFVKANLLNVNRLGRPDYDPARDPTVNKLLPKWLGPFPIEAVIGAANYKLTLPAVLRSHRTFNVDQLKKSFGCPPEFVGRPIRRTAPVLYDDQGQRIYVIAALLQKRRRRRRTQYLVQWADLPSSENSWEYVENISHVAHWQQLLTAFRHRAASD